MFTNNLMKPVYVFSVFILSTGFTAKPASEDSTVQQSTDSVPSCIDRILSDKDIINPTFNNLIDSARFYIKKDVANSLAFYLKAFAEEAVQNPVYLYESAVMAARSKQKDLAFFLLNLASEKKYSYSQHLSENKDFPSLDKEKFERCLGKVRQTDSLYTQISRQLDSVFNRDQDIRNYLYEEIFYKGKDTHAPEAKVIIDSMIVVDSLNLIIVDNMMTKYGFLGNSLKTDKSRYAMFLILQHSPQKIRERNMDIIIAAVKNGELSTKNFAYIADRTLDGRKKVQKFGTQYKRVDGNPVLSPPLIDPLNVDEYRKAYGLNSLEDYVKEMKKMEQIPEKGK